MAFLVGDGCKDDDDVLVLLCMAMWFGRVVVLVAVESLMNFKRDRTLRLPPLLFRSDRLFVHCTCTCRNREAKSKLTKEDLQRERMMNDERRTRRKKKASEIE